MNVEVLVLGPIQNNVYLIGDSESVIVVDPSCEAQRILEAIGPRKVEAILLTHRHWDHVGAAAELREATGAQVVANALDASAIEAGSEKATACTVDKPVKDGDTLELLGESWQVLTTPGHTQGSTCYFLEDGKGEPILVAGDTLFKGTHGRTDFEGGDPAAMEASLNRLAQLPPETLVLPGHNELTTIAAEGRWINA